MEVDSDPTPDVGRLFLRFSTNTCDSCSEGHSYDSDIRIEGSLLSPVSLSPVSLLKKVRLI